MLSDKIRESRVRAGLSQSELADKVGVSQPQVSLWERNQGKPSKSYSKKLEAILGGDDDGGSDDGSPLAAWLTKARLAVGLSVPELAYKSDLTPPAIYRIESGVTRNLRSTTQKKLERALSNRLPEDAAKEVADESLVIGLGKLEDFDPHVDSDRPSGSGIYVLYDISERPIYVGEGGNVKRRIRDHEDKFWFKRPIIESAAWICIPESELRKQIEALLIKFLKSNAVINKQHVERKS